MFKAMLHMHITSVMVFLIIYLIKTILLVVGATEKLEKFKAKTKVLEMIVSTAFIATGGYMLFNIHEIKPLLVIKIAIVFASIPTAIIAYKKGNKLLAMNLRINGKEHSIDAEPAMPLLWVLRDVLHMTGTKYGCGVAACGACTVHLDGKAVRTCILPASVAEGKEIRTIEGIGEMEMSAVQKAWIEHQVPQCGYCQSGMIMAVEVLLKDIPEPTDEDINRRITNICRCGTYQRIREAIKTAAQYRLEAKKATPK